MRRPCERRKFQNGGLEVTVEITAARRDVADLSRRAEFRVAHNHAAGRRAASISSGLDQYTTLDNGSTCL